jgi:hypothetical protein
LFAAVIWQEIGTQSESAVSWQEKETSLRSHDGVEEYLPLDHHLRIEKQPAMTITLGDLLSECQSVISERDLEEKGNCTGINRL